MNMGQFCRTVWVPVSWRRSAWCRLCCVGGIRWIPVGCRWLSCASVV